MDQTSKKTFTILALLCLSVAALTGVQYAVKRFDVDKATFEYGHSVAAKAVKQHIFGATNTRPYTPESVRPAERDEFTIGDPFTFTIYYDAPGPGNVMQQRMSAVQLTRAKGIDGDGSDGFWGPWYIDSIDWKSVTH